VLRQAQHDNLCHPEPVEGQFYFLLTTMKTSQQIRADFVNYWTSEPRNFKLVPNMSLVPNVDSTLLFVNSGMFPLAPYLGGQPHPLGKRLCNFQRCLRTNYDEMIEIGDNRHTLMFEMMGDWSLGDFFKEEQIPWILEYWVEVCGLDPHRIYVSVFEGDADAPIDMEAVEIWQQAFKKYGVDAQLADKITDVPPTMEAGKTWKPRIFKYPKKKNWWERAHAPNELGGPTSEMFYDLGEIQVEQDEYHINDDSGRFIEIGNNVFMQNRLDENMQWQNLPQKNIDFGGGFERVVMIIQGKSDIFETDIYWPIIERIQEISGKRYKDTLRQAQGDKEVDNEYTAAFRVIADHGRAATFIIADGVNPSNKDQGYILRRFIRRLIRFGKKLGIEQDFTKQVAEVVIDTLSPVYPHIAENRQNILEQMQLEEEKFRKTLVKGLKELEEIKSKLNGKRIDGKTAFYIYETYGFPLELTLDELGVDDKTAVEITNEFKVEEDAHRAASRSGAEQKFKGGLADHSAETTKLHTTHHLLLAAMQQIVSPDIKQKGSNITGERLRIDFNLDRKLTDEEIQKVEALVNEKIAESLPVVRKEVAREKAEEVGAQMEFGAKYPDIVSVYFIGGSQSERHPELVEGWFSAEFCGGPHVSNTSEIGEGGKKFKIFKQENVGAGVKRIKAGIV
jgi:alanyl-tRNA synthetase